MIKILYLILFFLIYRITDLVLLLVLLVQTVLNLFSGEPSASIKSFGKSLGVYLQQISEFLSYASEEKPFPFSDWPSPEDTEHFANSVNETATVQKTKAEEVNNVEEVNAEQADASNESATKQAGAPKKIADKSQDTREKPDADADNKS